MNKKKLIFSYVIQLLALGTLLLMFMPIIQAPGESLTVLELVLNSGKWVYMEEYLFGIAGLVTIISAPLLLITTELCKLSACGVIKCKKFDLAMYIVNIILTSFLVAVIVNYFLGLGRTIGMSGLVLFKGTTWFSYATAYFYLYSAFSIGSLVLACLNRNKK